MQPELLAGMWGRQGSLLRPCGRQAGSTDRLLPAPAAPAAPAEFAVHYRRTTSLQDFVAASTQQQAKNTRFVRGTVCQCTMQRHRRCTIICGLGLGTHTLPSSLVLMVQAQTGPGCCHS